MQHFIDLMKDCLGEIKEIFPWDLEEWFEEGKELMILDVREPYEFDAMHIPNSINVPRGILESACDYDYEETIPELVQAREREIVIVCRSGYRSILAASSMQRLGYEHVYSLKTGVRGWMEYEQPLVDTDEKPVDEDAADEYFSVRLRPEQMSSYYKK